MHISFVFRELLFASTSIGALAGRFYLLSVGNGDAYHLMDKCYEGGIVDRGRESSLPSTAHGTSSLRKSRRRFPVTTSCLVINFFFLETAPIRTFSIWCAMETAVNKGHEKLHCFLLR